METYLQMTAADQAERGELSSMNQETIVSVKPVPTKTEDEETTKENLMATEKDIPDDGKSNTNYLLSQTADIDTNNIYKARNYISEYAMPVPDESPPQMNTLTSYR